MLTPRPASVKEGHTGTQTMRIPLVLDRSLPGPLTLNAVASDYEATYARVRHDDIDTTITIAAGQLLGYIDVTVHGDTFDDVDAQYVYVDLTELTGGATFPSGFTDAYAFSYGRTQDHHGPPALATICLLRILRLGGA